MSVSSSTPYLLAALPCYNEADNLIPLLTKYAQLALFCGDNLDIRVIVIDDASRDNTQQVLEDIPTWIKNATHLEVVKHPENRGLTGGLLTALDKFYQVSSSPTPPLAMCLMDGDNSHNPGNILSMVLKILEGYDVVVASRYQPGSRIEGVNLYRRTLSKGMGLLFKICRNIPGVWDYSCGFRLYTPEIMRKLKAKFGDKAVTQRNFSCMVELLVNCHHCGAICTEVPFLLRYDLKQGESKMQVLKTIRGTLAVLNQ